MKTLDLVLLLVGIAFATVGLTGYAIFGPLTCRHLEDRGRGAEMGHSSLSMAGVSWLLRGGYRGDPDRNLRQLAAPARIMLWLIVVGLALTAVSWAV
jgi:hypothetical protein